MTRINVVPVWELSDQHLLAEYHELPRVIKQKINISDAPDKYCLGTGHMKWARKHARWTIRRFYELCSEMKFRGFYVAYDPVHLAEYDLELYKNSKYYSVRGVDYNLNRNRLVEKYQLKPSYYTWTTRSKPFYMKEKKMSKVEIYEYPYQWDNEEPEKVLSLKEFEEVFNNGDSDDIYKIRFVVA
jgi:hypothetical protein